jgi:hypothetical protein
MPDQNTASTTAATTPTKPLDLSEFGGKPVSPKPAPAPTAQASSTSSAKPLDLSEFGGKPVSPTTSQQDSSIGSTDSQPILSRALSGIGQSLYNTVVRPIKASTIMTPPQDATEHVIRIMAGDAPLNAYRAAKAVVASATNIAKSAGDAYPKAIQDFHNAYQQFKGGDYRDAAISGAETLGDAATIVDPTLSSSSANNREIAEGLRAGHDLATPLARQATDVGTMLAADALPKAAEYSPRSVDYAGNVEGKLRIANSMQGPINKSVSAAQRDVRYGDPAAAIMREGINAPDTVGRQVAAAQKLSELKPQLDSALDAAKGRVSLNGVVAPVLNRFMNKLLETAMSPAEMNAAVDEMQIAENRIAKYADPNGTISVREANDAKRELGDRVADWEKRQSPTSDLVDKTYHELYGKLKNEVNRLAGTADLNERISNLLSLRNSLAERSLSVKRGSLGTGSMAQNGILQRVEAAAGHVAPATIKAAQAATGAIAKTVPPAVVTNQNQADESPNKE